MIKIFRNIFVILLIFSFPILPQAFGFGCFGFVGGFGGYSYQQYKPAGLNLFVSNFNTTNSEYIDKELSEFNTATGYRFGINFFRGKFTSLFITAKGYYQQIDENHVADIIPTAVTINYDYDLKIKNWGIGVDVGIPITNYLSWKILDGSILINSAKLTETINSSQGTQVTNYNNDKTQLGYSIGSGFILELVKDYISLEGVASYTQFSIDKMKSEEGADFLYSPDKNLNNEKFIKYGGFNAVVQLNIGFPL
ncbi:MAG TPA: hypothetical protein DHV28_13860 [Ignavibacteriales bacterium]|nr:hypothetical protein [Ignavibacteriales bacterium]